MKKHILLILALSLLVRVIFTLVYPPMTTNDSPTYEKIAINLNAGHGYSDNDQAPYLPNLIRAPGYPVFIAAVYKIAGAHSREGLVIAQHVLGILIVLFSYLIAQRVLGSEKYAFLVGLVMAVHPILCLYEHFVMSEIFFIFLLMLVTLILLSSFSVFSFAVIGLIFGCATLTRPMGQFLPVVMAIWLVFSFPIKTWLPKYLLMLIIFFSVITPWVIHNKNATGYAGLVPMGGIAHMPLIMPLWHGVAEPPYADIKADMFADRKTFAEQRDYVEAADHNMWHLVDRGLSFIEINEIYSDLFEKTIKQNPVGYLGLAIYNLGSYYNGYNSICFMSANMPKKFKQNLADHDYPEIITKIIARGVLPYLVWIFSLIGIVLCLVKKNKASLLAILLILYFSAVVSAAVPAYDRYRLPIEPFLYMMAAYTVMTIRKKLPDTV